MYSEVVKPNSLIHTNHLRDLLHMPWEGILREKYRDMTVHMMKPSHQYRKLGHDQAQAFIILLYKIKVSLTPTTPESLCFQYDPSVSL